MRKISIVTFSRSEYSSCLPIMRAIQEDSDLELHVVASGSHLLTDFGLTVNEIERDGFDCERVEMALASDSSEDIAKSVGLGTMGFAQNFARFRPDLVLLTGDRLELLAVACVALPMHIPIAHVSGGDITEGAIDNQVRHGISKMSHLHFVSMKSHGKRLIQMGEEAWRVSVTGDPALDLVRHMKVLSREEVSRRLGIELCPPVLIVTYHPATLGSADPADEIKSLLESLDDVDGTAIFTYPNADAGNRVVIECIQDFVRRKKAARLYENLGQAGFYGVLSHADLMVGNSSSGIWEAPSFSLPVVNIGERQKGRLRADNVIDVPTARMDDIKAAIQRGLSPAFRARLYNMTNPYGDGYATQRIMKILKTVKLDLTLLQKRFVDLAFEKQATEGTI
ncbi:MAG: GDP/UDP-N,N'-diacetylbacillosamine 2-epimerase (hydrolyzing) [Syntrophorhabdus sp. PtaU1.Bin002]|nr:MAG: GDP/UDP-N,N'-diacetylbacillosamine 2-epimerase (hydrolyzing) [Syntrophorhabdus sp. PtaB.Bin006]OPY73565.1 MAG: GDP/UDP-N,N'-diacetylbacillosamine 2-epimerase (hydrolyzing) [Syntrophorhabdus sp. PtaU1.Bin002]